MKIVVWGAAKDRCDGRARFIGSHVADRLLGFGHEVLIVDNLASGSRANIPSSAQFEHCDVADASLAPLLQRWRGEVVVHCAAQVSVAVSMRDPAMDARSNIIGTIRTAQAAADSGCCTSLWRSGETTPASMGPSIPEPGVSPGFLADQLTLWHGR